MDDGICAVCAEALEWAAYGPCGHRDVCATCIARLRFVCDDRRCCICKSDSPAVFVTKELGSFTRVINDFSILPADAKDGKVGSYWFHEDTQAYFDDFDEYKIIKAMCRLSCSVCDKLEVEGKRSSKRRGKFKNVEQLKDHLSRQHELFFCSLCLENKKVFICEQKLYSRVQLRQHIKDGSSEVDGDESERCGFSGHPLCEFCLRPFYGDNELYFHLSTEHYTCHICQRQHSYNYEYYKDYDDLENHFRHAHFLCEDDSCLEKKFVVFSSEADMKRHNALEHGGHMSRSKRSAALQLPTCFRYQEREATHHVRAHASNQGVSRHHTHNAERTGANLRHDASLIMQPILSHSSTSDTGPTSDPMPSQGQVQSASLDFRNVVMSGSAFPPLPRTSKRRRRKSKKTAEETSTNTTISPVCSSNIGISAVNPSSTTPRAANQTPSAATLNGISSASSANPIENICSTKDVGSSSSTQNLVNGGSVGPSACGESSKKESNGQTANKSLVEGIRAALEFDKDKYAAFKIISKEYREGEIDAREYFSYVHQFGLAHLILDLAKLCPDPQKQKELIEIHKSNLGNLKENGQRRERSEKSGSKGSKKGKEKCEDNETGSKREALPDSIVNGLTEMKLNAEPHRDVSHSNGSGSNNSTGATANGSKKKAKKNPKFLRARIGESSSSEVQDFGHSNPTSYSMVGGPTQDSILASVRGVWRNGGGRRLVAMNRAHRL